MELMHVEERKQKEVIEELRKDVDMYMNSYLKEESRGKEKSVFYQASYAEVAELEQEVRPGRRRCRPRGRDQRRREKLLQRTLVDARR